MTSELGKGGCNDQRSKGRSVRLPEGPSTSNRLRRVETETKRINWPCIVEKGFVEESVPPSENFALQRQRDAPGRNVSVHLTDTEQARIRDRLNEKTSRQTVQRFPKFSQNSF